MGQYEVEYNDGPIRYIFTEDLTGTIVVIKAENDGQTLLPKLWALLKNSNGIVSDDLAWPLSFLLGLLTG